MKADQTLECQDCGDVIRHLTPPEAQIVASRPYDFVGYCTACRVARQKVQKVEWK